MDERRDDWHRGVDGNLASLNAGQRVWEREINVLHRLLAEVDHLLRGDPAQGTSGLLARLEDAERNLAKLNAVIFVDSTGKRGLLAEVDTLSRGERTSGDRWKFATAVVVAIISLLGFLLTNLDRIEAFYASQPSLHIFEQKPKRPKRPARRKPLNKVAPPPAPIQEPIHEAQ